MEGCIFCSIAKGDSPAARVWENERFLAVLDLYPNTSGQTIVITKEHFGSYLFDLDSELIVELLEAVKHVSGMLERSLPVKRVSLVFEGLEVDHIHAKLYPAHGLKSKFERIVPEDTVLFGKYPGYISTMHGPEVPMEELKRLARRISDYE